MPTKPTHGYLTEPQRHEPRAGDFARHLASIIRTQMHSGLLNFSAITLTDVSVDESNNIRIMVSDGSYLDLEITHMVPRDYFKGEPIP